MIKKLIFLWLIILLHFTSLPGQVRIRLFSAKSPESAIFSVTEGQYELDAFNGAPHIITNGEPVVITRYDGKLAVKTRNTEGFICDSVIFKGRTGNDSFSLQIKPDRMEKRYYSDDLQCFSDLETLMLINICDIEKYVSGVVKAEGGSGKNDEYFKSQAVIARTYMYRYFDRHLDDRYNLCDNTHCQAFNGLSDDLHINKAASETRNLVILSPDSTLIMSAFHSNCGGETSSSENVWLSSQPYLRRVIDPYCVFSQNARWDKIVSLTSWLDYIKRSGYNGKTDNPADFSFIQKDRLTDYKTGSFSLPLISIRTDMHLRSTYFSVYPDGDKIVLKGRGYGHGVGLCQEGAMVMAERGFNFRQIINFYYTGVMIYDIKNEIVLAPNYGTPTP